MNYLFIRVAHSESDILEVLRSTKNGGCIKCITVVSLLLMFVPLSCAAVEMHDGLWELATVMDMPGMKMPPQKMKHCYTKEDVKDQKKMVNNNKDCTVTELNTIGNKVSWKMKCTGKNAGTFSGETTFTGDSYDSIMKMQPQEVAMNMKTKGKRIGACK